MSLLRNLIIEITNLYFSDYDYLLEIDTDEFTNFRAKDSNWPLNILSSFAGQSKVFKKEKQKYLNIKVDPSWDMVCANGVAANRKMWDIFAFYVKYFDEEMLQSDWGVYPDIHPRFRPEFHNIAQKYNIEFIPVYSCFGPMAIYKIESLKECRYFDISPDCEHASLHGCFIRKGMTNYINPYMMAFNYPEPGFDTCYCLD